MESTSLSVILPTLNEGKNLEFLIPSIIRNFKSLSNFTFEIIVVDDGSTDDTAEILNKLNSENLINFVQRTKPPSLPMSIYEGIENAKYQNVAWLDADGSMSGDILKELVIKLIEKNDSVIIGSRFVDGGGYKGIKELGKTSIYSAIKNVYNSNDSVPGMIFSTLFNQFLRYILNVNVKDITSGFIVGNKEYFTKKIFEKSEYGEYFIYLMNDLYLNNVDIIEYGYVCETRMYGVSKTSSNILQLINRGIPYIKAANNCRKVQNWEFTMRTTNYLQYM